MAVLVEAISVVIQLTSIEKYIGLDNFDKFENNNTLCTDGFLARLGFMKPEDVEAYTKRLEEAGLCHQLNKSACDFVVIDQQSGCTTRCDWLKVGKVDPGFGVITCCRHLDDGSMQVFTPEGWEYPGSMSETFGFSPSEANKKGLRFLRHENGIDVYFSDLSGKEVFVGRTSD
ncbi:hypothetical protein N9U06_01140 [Gammaproteobacteria bacterium]|nr:hypothetical protein [Gammaproteobacteria bacterium]